MIIKIKVTKNFKKEAKILLKKYPSLDLELKELQNKLRASPVYGTPLGSNLYKIRLAIRSKGKGKSGGARVITFLETEVIGILSESKSLSLISIYDKSEVSNLTSKELKELIKNIQFD